MDVEIMVVHICRFCSDADSLGFLTPDVHLGLYFSSLDAILKALKPVKYKQNTQGRILSSDDFVTSKPVINCSDKHGAQQ